ncbi:unknown [Feldmannia species virus]|uniref:Glutaredoxin n=1 Tax=Feldmannia species virus TaxID=39420 RepID=B5LWE0_9PHYC|nr:hypothetical protein FeldSpV_gp051 [Feldmannia species virus]ACH46803.1 unknown [Feldmannia species virus]
MGGKDNKIHIYTHCSRCPFSKEIVDLAKSLQNISMFDLGQIDPPPWLPGTPTVVDGADVYCGDAAFSFLETLEDIDDNSDENPRPSKRPGDYGQALAQAFKSPEPIDVDESSFDVSTDDMLERILAGRR